MSKRGMLAALVAGALLAPWPLAAPASADGCNPVSWTAPGDGSWTDVANWTTGAVPGPNDAVFITPDRNTPHVISDMTGSVCSVTITGGVGSADELILVGSLTAASAAVDGFVTYRTADESAAPAAIDVTGPLELQPGADLTLTDDHSDLHVGGALSVGDASTVHGASASAPPHLAVDGSLQLEPGSTTTVGDTISGAALDLGSGAVLDPNGTTLTLAGPGISHWSPGASIGAGHSGSVTLGSAAHVVIADLTVQSPAVLVVSGTDAILDGASGGTIRGTGTVNWQAGSMEGAVTLAQAGTTLTSGGSRFIPVTPTSSLVNKSAFTMIDNGYLRADGPVENDATMTFRPGGSIMSLASPAPTFRNAPGATLAVEAQDPSQPAFPSDQVLVYGVNLVNEGTISIPGAERLFLVGAPGSRLVDGDTVTGAGTLQIGNQATLTLAGTTHLASTVGVVLDDQSDGTQAHLVGGDAQHAAGVLAGTLAPAGTTTSSFFWHSGTIAGQVALSNIANYILSTGSSTGRLLGDGTTATALRVQGPAIVSDATVSVAPKAALDIGSDMVVSGSNAGFDAGTGEVDQLVTVDAGGSLSVTQVPANGTTPAQPSNAVIAPTFVNRGTVAVDASTLTLPLGYTQSEQAGAPATAQLWTGLSNGGTLQVGTSDQPKTLTVNSGGLGGVGTVSAGSVVVGSGWLHPGYATGPGRLVIDAPLTLTSKSETRIVVWPPVPGTTAPQHDMLTVNGVATLAGRVTTFTQSNAQKWKPAYLSRLNAVITATTRSSGFGTVAWGGTAPGLGWRPYYGAATVDLKLVDVAPPTPRQIAVSAFTEVPSSRITYVAVDPYAPTSTGVAAYDVRWQSGTPTKRFGAWHYPKGWQNTRATSVAEPPISPGTTYCVSIRVRDKQGNQSAWTVPVCSARMVDDKAVSATSSWVRRNGVAGLYNNTYSMTTTAGATLSWRGTFRRIAVAAYRCPTCGTVNIYAGSRLVKRWSLASRHSGMVSWISKLMPSRTATVRIRCASSGRNVMVDAVGLMR